MTQPLTEIKQDRSVALDETVTLSNGRLQAELSANGLGHLVWHDHAITAPAAGVLRPGLGHALFCRDLDQGPLWSAGFHPTCVGPENYECRAFADRLQIRRLDFGIELTTSYRIDQTADLLYVWCQATNRCGERRSIELASYMELALQPASDYGAHPAFSKLFVETEWLQDERSIHVQRRPRDAGQQFPQLLHWVQAGDGTWNDREAELAFETSRMAFIGRGRDLSCPRALCRNEGAVGQTGTVLDPIASLRFRAELQPGQSVTGLFVTAVGESPGQLQACRDAAMPIARVPHELNGAATAPPARSPAFGRPSASQGSGHPLTMKRLSVEESTESSPQQQRVQSPTCAVSPFAPPKARNRRAAALAKKVAPTENSLSDRDFRGAKGDTGVRSCAANEQLQFENGIGGFSEDGSEYVIRLSTDADGHLRLPPLPWTNVIANERAGFIISETGASCTWAENSRQNRLTPWYNDPVLDPHGEAIYVRDEGRRLFWSALPGPTPHPGEYEVRHGFGYTRFTHAFEQIDHEVTCFVPTDAACKVTHVRLTNHSAEARRISLFGFQRWVIGDTEAATAGEIEAHWDAGLLAVLAQRTGRDRLAYSSVQAIGGVADQTPQLSAATDVADFIGHPSGERFGDIRSPYGVSHSDTLTGARRVSEGEGGTADAPAAALQLTFELPANDNIEVVFLLGEAESADEIAQLQQRFATSASIAAERDAVRQQWDQLARPFKVETPSKALNLMANGWLNYQNISCRIWGRSSFYQGGGAFGFRDQLQDAAALMYHRPEMTREQILIHAAHQFIEGDVLHWWHHDNRLGIRTRFADDLLWLPLVAAEYVATTGDEALWGEVVPFLTDRQLEEGEDEALLQPEVSDETGTVLEHCCRALDRSLATGSHGLPLMGTGDWNDGMNRVGRAGTGESVWMGFFLCRILDLMLPVLRRHDQQARAERYGAHQAELKRALNTEGWDGEWFLRAFHDDGQKIGSAANAECRIDALSQAWSVISGACEVEKQRQGMAAVDRLLVDEEAGLIRLLTPPFYEADIDPGYIKGYLPGLRENGGQYTHGILWAIRAFAELGSGDRAAKLLEMISPATLTSAPEGVARYQTEPYVVAADVYSVPPHAGRGGWSWYTGSAGWTFRVLWESILGITIRNGDTLHIAPRIPADWPGFSVEYRLPGEPNVYTIKLTNPNGKQQGITRATLDGEPIRIEQGAAHIPLTRGGRNHTVKLEM